MLQCDMHDSSCRITIREELLSSCFDVSSSCTQQSLPEKWREIVGRSGSGGHLKNRRSSAVLGRETKRRWEEPQVHSRGDRSVSRRIGASMPTWRINSGANSGARYSGSALVSEDGKPVGNDQARAVAKQIAEDRHRGLVVDISLTRKELPAPERTLSLATEADVSEEESLELQKRITKLYSQPMKEVRHPVSQSLRVMKIKLLKHDEIITVEDDNLHSLVEISEDIRKGDWVQLRLLSDFTAVWEKVPQTVSQQWEKEVQMEVLMSTMPEDEVAKSRGNTAFKRGDFEMAERYYSQAIRCNHNSSIYFCNRALSRIKLRRFNEAVEDCTCALQIDPMSIKALLRRGHSHLEMGSIGKAVKDFQAVMQLEPGNPDAVKKMQEVEKRKADLLTLKEKNAGTLFPELL